jgi:CheY-like chemotaxis protein
MASILFVDDDEFMLETYEKIISLFGHQAILADTAEAAFIQIETQQPDMIVLDNQLPDVEGLDVLKILRSNTSTASIPVVMVSASPDVVAMQAKAAGAQYFLSKPIFPEDLIEILEENKLA